MKKETLIVPRLELKAAALPVDLKLAILHQLEFPVSTLSLWSNSLIIINYICNTSKKIQIFVIKRLHEIRLNSTVTEWNYVQGLVNPAEMWTRHTPLQRLHPESVSIHRPVILYQNNTKVSENKIYNLSHEPDSIKSSCLRSMTKHQE